ncbi:MAG: PP0621 family protein [Campylobacterales bacterium]
MLKYLVVIGVIAFIYFVFIKKKPLKSTKKQDDDTKANEMVECYKCHIYCELDEAILSNGHYYCCESCLKG